MMALRTPVEMERAERLKLQEQIAALQSKCARQAADIQRRVEAMARQDKARADLLAELRRLRTAVRIVLSEAELAPPPDLGRAERAAYRQAVDDVRAAIWPAVADQDARQRARRVK